MSEPEPHGEVHEPDAEVTDEVDPIPQDVPDDWLDQKPFDPAGR